MVKRVLKVLVVLLILGIAGIQFFRPEFKNPVVKKGERLEDLYEVPPDVATVLKRSCGDCHSNETVYPWYSKIAPMSWGMADHINVGRDELNFSVWGTYSEKRQKRKLEEICEEVEEGNMPHYQYLWLHWDANLSDSEKETLCSWTKSAVGSATEPGEPK